MFLYILQISAIETNILKIQRRIAHFKKSRQCLQEPFAVHSKQLLHTNKHEKKQYRIDDSRCLSNILNNLVERHAFKPELFRLAEPARETFYEIPQKHHQENNIA